MKTVSRQSSFLIALILLVITAGLLFVMHVTSGGDERCALETVNISVLKLI